MVYDDLIGVPFVDGGRDAKTGLDCWGLAREYYRRLGLTVQDYHVEAINVNGIAEKMAAEKEAPYWVRLDAPVPHSLLLIRLNPEVWANHVGIYLDKEHFLHAYAPTGVCIDKLRRWRNRLVGFYLPAGGEKIDTAD